MIAFLSDAFVLLVSIALCFFVWKQGYVTYVVFAAAFVFAFTVSTVTRLADVIALLLVVSGLVFWPWFRKSLTGFRSRRHDAGAPPGSIQIAIVALVAIVLAFTVTDLVFTSSITVHTRQQTAVDPEFQGKRVAVALSGGGYRAAIMHAGVLDALRHFGIPITSLSSVSGGSIMSSYYARGGEPRDVVEGTIDGKLNLKRRLVDFRNIFRQRRELEADLVDQQITYHMIMTDPSLTIPVIYGSTDVKAGKLIGIMATGSMALDMVHIANPNGLFVNIGKRTKDVCEEAGYLTNWMPAGNLGLPKDLKLSTVVAASGAFPLAFEPYNVHDMQLVDGGVTDNSAVTLLLQANLISRICNKSYSADLAAWKSDVIISSDAGKPFTRTEGNLGLLGSIGASSDALYARSGPRPTYSDQGSYQTFAPPSFRLNPNDLYLREAELDGTLVNRFAVLPDKDQAAFMQLLIDEKGSDDVEREMASEALPPKEPESDGQRTTRVMGFENWMETNELLRELKSFQEASTLQSEYSATDADRLYRLGWFLAAINIDEIRKELRSPSRIPCTDTATYCSPTSSVAAIKR